VHTFDARNSAEITLDISALRPGTYFIRMLKREGADSEILIKK
jgi:hypothetical protein